MEALTDWDLFTEMVPVTPNVGLHHLPAQHMSVITAVTFKKSLLLSSYWCMVRLVEAFFDQINNLLALLFGQNSLGEAGIKQARNSHRMVRLLMAWRKESTKIDIIGKIRCVVLALCVRIAIEILVWAFKIYKRRLTLHGLADPPALVKSCLFVDR